MKVAARIRIITENKQGYIIESAEEATYLFNGLGGTSSNIRMIDTNSDDSLSIIVDDNYSIRSLYQDVCIAIGIKPVLAVDADWPIFPILIEFDDNYLISIDDYRTSLIKILGVFDTKEITVYLLVSLGKGEVYRGDGIRMYIIAEPGVRHNYAHVHVDGKDGRNATVTIEKEIVFKGNLNLKEKKRAKKVIKDNIEELREIWKKLTIEGVSVDVDYKLGRICIANR